MHPGKAIRLLAFLFLMGGITTELSGQNPFLLSGKSLVELRHSPVLPLPAFSPSTLLTGSPGIFPKKNSPELAAALLYPSPGRQPGIYSYEDLALFCKIEVQLERALRMPVRIRLGDVQYVDWLEGKRDLPGN